MEQVFDLVNGILRRDRETWRRQLRVRDYKVIPLASQAGLLEFVANTAPLKDWLYKAHRRFICSTLSSSSLLLKIHTAIDLKTTNFLICARKSRRHRTMVPHPKCWSKPFLIVRKSSNLLCGITSRTNTKPLSRGSKCDLTTLEVLQRHLLLGMFSALGIDTPRTFCSTTSQEMWYTLILELHLIR